MARDDRNHKRLIGRSISYDRFSGPRAKQSQREAFERRAKHEKYGGRNAGAFLFDIETTGLRSEIVYNPSEIAWRSDIHNLDLQNLGPGGRIRAARELNFFKYFEEVGLAQIAYRDGRGSSKTKYSIWSDDITKTPGELRQMLGAQVRASEFGVKRGIYARSLAAHAKGKAITEADSALEFAQSLMDSARNGKIKLVGHNVWYDIAGMQSFMIRHAEHLQRHNVDPLLLINKYISNDLVINASEDAFFDILRHKGLQDKSWAQQHLVFGKRADLMFPGVQHGSPIDLMQDLKRVQAGKQSFLRSRSDWNLEALETSLLQYTQFSGAEVGVPLSKFRALSAHDALYDIGITNVLQNRLSRTASYFNTFSAMPNMSWQQTETLSFARAGLLGNEFTGQRIKSDIEFADWLMSKDAKFATAQERTEKIWSDWAGMPEKKYGIPKSQPKMLGRFKSLPPHLRYGSIAAAVLLGGGLLYGSTYERDKLKDNVPPNYIPGQQAANKVIDVPWNSPYSGMETDETNARNMVLYGLPALTFGVLPLVANKPSGKALINKLYYGTRALENITPLRIGQMLGLSSALGSLAAPNKYSISSQRLLGTYGLTELGDIYARGMNVEKNVLFEYLTELNEAYISAGKTSPGVRFTRTRAGYSHKVNLADDILLDHLNKLEKSGINSDRLARIQRVKKLVHDGRTVKLFNALSRKGRSFSTYGVPESRLRGAQQSWRKEQNLLSTLRGSSVKRWLYNNVGFMRSIIERHGDIRSFDADPILRFHRRFQPSQEIFVPAYEGIISSGKRAAASGNIKNLKGGIGRFVGGTLYDWHKSAWHLLRAQGKFFGVNIGPAPSLRAMGRKMGKAGLAVAGTIGAFELANNLTNGFLARTLWHNPRDRISLAHAWISDKLGFTDIKKRHPEVGAFAPFAFGTLPFVGLATAAYFRRSYRALRHDLPHEIRRAKIGVNPLWRKGSSVPISEYATRPGRSSFLPTKNFLGVRVLKKLTRRARPGEKALPVLRNFVGNRRLNLLGKGAVGAWLGATALMLPFLGSSETYEEQRDILSGAKKVEVRKGRWWEIGSTPFEGERTAYYRYHQSVMNRLRAEEKIPGGGQGISAIYKDLVDPYWREKEAYSDRPYPITGGEPFGEVPFIGPILAKTIGRFLKPPKLMHTEEWQAGQDYNPYGAKMEKGTELPPPTPTDPLGWRGQIGQTFYRSTEFMGLRGYFIQSELSEPLTRGETPFTHAGKLQASDFNNFTKSFYEKELGGMAAMNELFRRFYPRPLRELQVNPLKNRMPSWMPGEGDLINFQEGDPYSKVPYGAYRLPGAGFEEIHPELKGVSPAKYPAWARHEILADVAPWSTEYKIWKSVAQKNIATPAEQARFEEIEAQAEDRRQRKRFQEYSFLEKTDRIKGTVTEVLPDGRFKLRGYGNHTFTIAGADFGLNKTAEYLRSKNSWTKQKAVEHAARRSQNRHDFLSNRLVGNTVDIKIHKGGLNRPDVNAEVMINGQGLSSELVNYGFAAPTPGRYNVGALGNIYGKMIEGLTHLPQKIPGPFFLNTKFSNEMTAIEKYKKEELYGKSFRPWNEPFESFLRPYLYSAVNKLTGNEFTPAHIQRKRDLEKTYDRIKFMKAVQQGDTRTVNRTAAGMDVFGSERAIRAALPYADRPYFEHFIQETDPEARKEILGMVSMDMQRALVGQWTKQYSQVTGSQINAAPKELRIQQSMAIAEQEIQKAGYSVPNKEWAGWKPDVDIEDIKAIHVEHEGMNLHDFNIWDDRRETLFRKPSLRGSHLALLSRPPVTDPSILSRTMSNNAGSLIPVSEHLSYSMISRFNSYNQVNYREYETSQYQNTFGGLID